MKKIFSLLLVAVVVFTCMPVKSLAATSDYETEEELTYSSDNPVGDALISAMSENEEETENNGGYGIFGLTIDGLTVNVSLSAPDNGTLVVAVFDEDTMQMITTGKTAVNSDMKSTTLTLAECTLPDYYIIKAFLLDAHNAPVCNQYENAEHTKSYEEFFSKNVYDFEEEKIINFDSGTESNFAVVSDESTVVTYSGEENIVVTDDYENGIYVFKNANEEITSLVSGDVFYYVYGEGADEYILTKVGSVVTKDGLTTITAADECEMGELFSYIDIDTSKMETPQTYAAGLDEDGGQLDEESSFSIGNDSTKEINGDNYNLKLSVSGEISFNIKFHYDLKLFGEDYYKFEYWAALDANANIEFEAFTTAEKKVNLVDKDITVFFGIDIHVELNVTLKASASLTFKGEVLFSMKNGASRESGGVQKRIQQKPGVEFNVDIDGNYSLSVIPELVTGFKVLKVYHVNLSVPVDFNTSGTLYVPTSEEELAEHSCAACIDGTVSATPSLKVNVKFGIRKSHLMDIIDVTPLTKKIPLGDYYISLNSGIKFGWGACPNNSSDTGSSGSGSSDSDSTGTSSVLYELLITGQVAGTCGDNLIWTLYSDGELVIDGTGAVTDYLYASDVPWYDCRTLVENVTMAHGITSIGDYAFYGCENITSVSMPDSIVALGWEAFSGCSSLVNIALPDSITDIGDYTFNRCYSLKAISIPYGVTELGWYVFSGCISLESIVIPDSVEVMYEGVFSECTNLKSIKLSNKTTDMGDKAFLFCSNLESIIIPDSVTNIGESAFDSCTNLKSIVIPDSVTSMDDFAFYNCTNLTEVTIGNSVTSIGEWAFAHCKSLANIIIPDSVTIIGNYAFYECVDMESVEFSNGIEEIGYEAFYSCFRLKELTIPKSVKSIGDWAFAACESLREIAVDADNSFYCSEEGVLFDINKTEIISFPGGSDIETYFVPESVVTIRSGAFVGCNTLVDVMISDSVTTMGRSAFAYSSSLTNVIIGTGMTGIEGSMFMDCVTLTNIMIPESITFIDDGAFKNCTALSNIYYTGTEEQWSAIVVGVDNGPLTSAEIIYNFTPEENAVSVMSLSAEYDTITASEEPSVITKTKTVNSAVEGNSYLILVVKDVQAEDLLSNENLVYIDQKVADSSCLAFEYTVTDASVLYSIVVISADLSAQNHMHSYTSSVTTPTCTEAGYITYDCKCGYSYVEETSALGHSYTAVATPPTCTLEGYTTYICHCGDVYTADETSALGHTEVIDEAVAPTCTAPGLTEGKYCSVCNAVLIQQTITQAKGHTYLSLVTPPTCTLDGYTTYTCHCGDTYTADETPALGHTDSNSDGKCDSCNTALTQSCSCMCHKTGFMGFIWKILRFFYKIFGINEICSCGKAHY